MTQERRPERPQRPELGMTVFQPQQGADLQVYRATQDLDQKALVLNRQIVQVEGVAATPGSVRNVAMIVAEQQRGLSQYRADAVAGLNPENLVAMVNGLTADEQEIIDPVSGAIKRIQQAEERSSLREAGFRATGQEARGKDEDMDALEDEVFGELAERLVDEHGSFDERRELIASIDAMITPQALRRISKRGEVLGAFIRSAEEFNNEELRNVLKRIQEKHDL